MLRGFSKGGKHEFVVANTCPHPSSRSKPISSARQLATSTMVPQPTHHENGPLPEKVYAIPLRIAPKEGKASGSQGRRKGIQGSERRKSRQADCLWKEATPSFLKRHARVVRQYKPPWIPSPPPINVPHIVGYERVADPIPWAKGSCWVQWLVYRIVVVVSGLPFFWCFNRERR
jgi:hypothetical protein